MDTISVTSMNRIAEIGQPCLTSLLRQKKAEIYPLFFTHTDVGILSAFHLFFIPCTSSFISPNLPIPIHSVLSIIIFSLETSEMFSGV